MAGNGSFYGRDRFDPLLILAQIVLLQACFYLSYLLLLMVFNRATGTTARLTDQIFDHSFVTLRHFPGWVTCCALFLSAAGPTAFAYVAVVGRAKRCIDFACTLLLSHIIATTIHSGFPLRYMWWLLNILSTIALATVGEALSMRMELRDISVNSRPEIPLPSTTPDQRDGPAQKDAVSRSDVRERGSSALDAEKEQLVQPAV